MQLTTAFLAMSVMAVTVANPMPDVHADANATAAVAPKAKRGFSLTCSELSLSGTGTALTLEAVCKTSRGGTAESTLPLSDCLGNANGFLQCASNGNAMATCDNCLLGAVFPALLACTCKNRYGRRIPTVIGLDFCITNDDGALTC